ncbi:dihydrofolate reductase [Legionella antarctica]|uniref:Dihydrofolate reductase n=1 Tax=Legionella antarctica TaxID=2708020 RepID=A0A6F8T1U9_9GAMM|nr:dihydrofolate reductase [Legionella antarctica]BCA93992.1 dihydrofolate reductase [Legionella antarctica]
MPTISLIAAVDEEGGIGRNNQLLCYLPADLKHFKTFTMGKPIIMGRKTFESIGKPLPGRTNIVLSHSSSSIDGVLVVDSLSRAINSHEKAEEIMIIGGADIFAQAMGMATRLYITCIHHQFHADVFFPKIDASIWSCPKKEFRQRDSKNEYDMTFYIYERN